MRPVGACEHGKVVTPTREIDGHGDARPRPDRIGRSADHVWGCQGRLRRLNRSDNLSTHALAASESAFESGIPSAYSIYRRQDFGDTTCPILPRTKYQLHYL